MTFKWKNSYPPICLEKLDLIRQADCTTTTTYYYYYSHGIGSGESLLGIEINLVVDAITSIAHSFPIGGRGWSDMRADTLHLHLIGVVHILEQLLGTGYLGPL